MTATRLNCAVAFEQASVWNGLCRDYVFWLRWTGPFAPTPGRNCSWMTVPVVVTDAILPSYHHIVPLGCVFSTALLVMQRSSSCCWRISAVPVLPSCLTVLLQDVLNIPIVELAHGGVEKAQHRASDQGQMRVQGPFQLLERWLLADHGPQVLVGNSVAVGAQLCKYGRHHPD